MNENKQIIYIEFHFVIIYNFTMIIKYLNFNANLVIILSQYQ